jgi:hypothetical protein
MCGDGWNVSSPDEETGGQNGSAYPIWSGNSILTGKETSQTCLSRRMIYAALVSVTKKANVLY